MSAQKGTEMLRERDLIGTLCIMKTKLSEHWVCPAVIVCDMEHTF
jgi:hypothetical protein